MSKLSKRHFWEWFNRHKKEYLELGNKSKKEAGYWLNELNAHLRAYYKFFGFSLSLHPKETAGLTITVNGKAMHFKKVEAFVAMAPEIPGWRISALENPMPVDFFLEKQMEAAGIDPREFYFSISDDEPPVTDIILYHPLWTDHNKGQFLQLACAAIYNLLGERSFGMDIGHLEVTNLSYAEPEDLYKLEELPGIIGCRTSSFVVNNDGRLLDGN